MAENDPVTFDPVTRQASPADQLPFWSLAVRQAGVVAGVAIVIFPIVLGALRMLGLLGSAAGSGGLFGVQRVLTATVWPALAFVTSSLVVGRLVDGWKPRVFRAAVGVVGIPVLALFMFVLAAFWMAYLSLYDGVSVLVVLGIHTVLGALVGVSAFIVAFRALGREASKRVVRISSAVFLVVVLVHGLFLPFSGQEVALTGPFELGFRDFPSEAWMGLFVPYALFLHRADGAGGEGQG